LIGSRLPKIFSYIVAKIDGLADWFPCVLSARELRGGADVGRGIGKTNFCARDGIGGMSGVFRTVVSDGSRDAVDAGRLPPKSGALFANAPVETPKEG
jgi:hypothetical protein